jgi:4-amino-4-deoxy-L-arabinose transferase-like glycosyltransferase
MAARLRARLRQAPASLLALLALVTIVGVAWALTVPPWQVPDEDTHFAYVQTLVQNGSLPSAKRKHTFSSDQRLAMATVGASSGKFYPAEAPPNWSRSAWQSYQDRVSEHPLSRSDGGGPSVSTNPPLFYIYSALPYLLDHGGTIFGQLYAMRIWSVLLLDLTALAAWLLAGEVFGRRQSLQLVAAAVGSLMPMSSFVSTAVNPDALLITLWTFALWLVVRVVRRGAQNADTVALCAVVAAAVLTKATSYALFFPLVGGFGAAWRLSPSDQRRATLIREAKALPVLLVPVVVWLVAARAVGFDAVNQVPPRAHSLVVTPTGFLDYLWQFYLPRLPFMPVAKLQSYLPAFFTWTAQGLGDFGFVSVPLPQWIYTEAEWITPLIAVAVFSVVVFPSRKRMPLLMLGGTVIVIGVLGAAGQLQYTSSLTALAVLAILLASLASLASRRKLTERQALLLVLSSAVFGLLLLLHATDYLIYARERTGFMEGRYLLPLVGVLGLGVALLVARLPYQIRPTIVGVTMAGLLGLQVVSLATVVHAYYL